MAKQLIHIGVAVSTVGDGQKHPDGSAPSGLVPGRSNIINIAAVCGDAYKFNANIVPATGVYGDSPFWLKHPEELEKLKRTPVPLTDALLKFRTWLKQFQGTLVACSSSVDFWHLLDAFFKTGKDCPFGTTGIIDTGTLAMVYKGKQRPVALTDQVEPLGVAKARWAAVTQGTMPPFGVKPVLKRRATVTGYRLGDTPLPRTWADTITVNVPPPPPPPRGIRPEDIVPEPPQAIPPRFARMDEGPGLGAQQRRADAVRLQQQVTQMRQAEAARARIQYDAAAPLRNAQDLYFHLDQVPPRPEPTPDEDPDF